MSKLIRALEIRKRTREAIGQMILVATPIHLYKINGPMTLASQVLVTGRIRLTNILFTRDADIECIYLHELNSSQRYRLKGPRSISMLDWFLKGVIPTWYKRYEEAFVKITK